MQDDIENLPIEETSFRKTRFSKLLMKDVNHCDTSVSNRRSIQAWNSTNENFQVIDVCDVVAPSTSRSPKQIKQVKANSSHGQPESIERKSSLRIQKQRLIHENTQKVLDDVSSHVGILLDSSILGFSTPTIPHRFKNDVEENRSRTRDRDNKKGPSKRTASLTTVHDSEILNQFEDSLKHALSNRTILEEDEILDLQAKRPQKNSKSGLKNRNGKSQKKSETIELSGEFKKPEKSKRKIRKNSQGIEKHVQEAYTFNSENPIVVLNDDPIESFSEIDDNIELKKLPAHERPMSPRLATFSEINQSADAKLENDSFYDTRTITQKSEKDLIHQDEKKNEYESEKRPSSRASITSSILHIRNVFSTSTTKTTSLKDDRAKKTGETHPSLIRLEKKFLSILDPTARQIDGMSDKMRKVIAGKKNKGRVGIQLNHSD
ncbi:hypothetical protein HK096_009192 [Nowakowskiella sp. JEL0078]|nr:hypothetical protein HK096_009192 [Nowakowskiella sp. JEL0078]